MGEGLAERLSRRFQAQTGSAGSGGLAERLSRRFQAQAPQAEFERGIIGTGEENPDYGPSRFGLQENLRAADEAASSARLIENTLRPAKGAVAGVQSAMGAAEQLTGTQAGFLTQDRLQGLQSRMAPPAETTFQQVLEGVGQALPIMATGAASLPVAAGLGALQQAGGAYQNSLAATGNEEESRKVLIPNLFVGLLESALPGVSKLPGASKVLGRLVPMLTNLDQRSKGVISRGLVGAITEGSTEAAQNVLENAIANFATSEERDLWQGATQEGEVGGYVGAILNMALGRRAPNLEASLARSQAMRESGPAPVVPVRQEAGPQSQPGLPLGEPASQSQEHITPAQEPAIPQTEMERATAFREATEERRIAGALDRRIAETVTPTPERRAIARRLAEKTASFEADVLDPSRTMEDFEALRGEQIEPITEQELRDADEDFAAEAGARERVQSLQGEADTYLERQLAAHEAAGQEVLAQAAPSQRDIVSTLVGAGRESTAELRSEVSDPRYGELGTILFDFRGKTYQVPEPPDVLPVGGGEAGKAWAVRQLLEKKAKPLSTARAPSTPEEIPDALEAEPRERIEEEQGGPPEIQPVMAFPGGLLKTPGVKEVAAFAKRELTSKGDLPDVAFRAKVARQGGIGAEVQKAEFAARDLKREIKRFLKFGQVVRQETASGSIEVRVGKRPLGQRKLTEEQTELLSAALKGNPEAMASLPSEVAGALNKMRLHVDTLSRRLVSEGVVQGELAALIDSNLGVYLNRSYQVFDDPKWSKNVPKDVFNRAVNLIRTQAALAQVSGDPKAVARAQTDPEAYVRSLLDDASKSDGFLGMIREGKLGSKDLSILKHRKEIAPEIRALFGEYTNPLVQYMRSVQKMAGLLESHKFLSTVKKEGMGKFLFKKPQGEHIRKIAASGSDVMAPLNGLYTTPEIERAFSEQFAAANDVAWLRLWMKANGIAKYGKTVLSPMTHVRNTLGNSGFAVANGHWRLNKWKPALKGIGAKLGVADSAESRAYVEEMIRLGVLDEGTRAGEIRDVLRDAMKGDPEDFAASGAKRVLGRANKMAVNAYQLEDNIWKLYAFENEMARYKGLGLSEADLKAKAAQIVRDTYPTYSLVPKGVQRLRRFPLAGPFVSWSAEVVRTAKNTLTIAAKDLASNNKTRRIAGAERLAGTIVASSLAASAALASRIAQGISDEDDEDARVFVPPWSKNSDIVWLGRNEKGNRTWIDLSYTDPWSYLKEPVQALIRGDSIDDKIQGALKAALEPFMSEEIFTQAAIDIARNKKSTGGEVYNEAAPANDQAKDMAEHMLKAVTPGVYTQLSRIYLGLKGYTNQYGKSYDPGLEALSMLSGVRINELDPQQGLGFIGGAMEKDYQGASSILTGVAARRGTVSDDELIEAYEKTERVRRKAFKEMDKAFKAAVGLGTSVDDAKRALSGRIAAKYIRDLELGQYQPYRPTGAFLESYIKSSKPEEKAEYLRRKALIEAHARAQGILQLEDL